MAPEPVDALLVNPTRLAGQLGNPDCVVVDCRFDLFRPDAGQAAFRAARIPGARYAHLDHDLSGPRTATTGRHPLPDPEVLMRKLGAFGLTRDRQLVVYDDGGGYFAARLWWLARWVGHRNARILDGGFAAWRQAGLSVESGEPAAVADQGAYPGQAGQMPTMTAAQIEQRLAAAELLLIDVRAAERFRGDVEPIDPVAGHVPGAINIPGTRFLTSEGRFLDPAALRSVVSPAGDGRDVACMCGSGVTACHGVFALALAGLPGAALYPGSWSEWIRSPDRPVAGGPA